MHISSTFDFFINHFEIMITCPSLLYCTVTPCSLSLSFPWIKSINCVFLAQLKIRAENSWGHITNAYIFIIEFVYQVLDVWYCIKYFMVDYKIQEPWIFRILIKFCSQLLVNYYPIHLKFQYKGTLLNNRKQESKLSIPNQPRDHQQEKIICGKEWMLKIRKNEIKMK